MELPINNVNSYVPLERTNETGNVVWSKITSVISSIKACFSALIDVLAECLARLKSFISGKQSDAERFSFGESNSETEEDFQQPIPFIEWDEEAFQQLMLSKEKDVKEKDVTEIPTSLYNRRRVEVEVHSPPRMPEGLIRQRWEPIRNKLKSMLENLNYPNANKKNVLFDSNTSCCEMLISLLREKAGPINQLLDKNEFELKPISDSEIEFMQREMITIEKVVQLLEMSLKARKENNVTKVICHETVLLAKMLHMFLRKNHHNIASIDKESAAQKQKQHGELWSDVAVVINTMEDLKSRVSPSDVDSVEKEIDPVVFRKSQELFEMVGMLSTKRLSLERMDDSGYVDDAFLKIFQEKYPGVESDGKLLSLLLLIDTDGLDSQNATHIDIWRHYAEGLDEAKRLFYEEQSEERALNAAVDLLKEVFNIQPRSIEG